MTEQRFKYKLPLVILILGFFLLSPVSVLLTLEALNNEQGLLINNTITLSVNGATIFYWSVAACMIITSAFLVFMLFVSLTTNKELILTEHYIQAPRTFLSKKNVTLDYSRIIKMNILEINKQKILTLHSEQDHIKLGDSFMENKADFRLICNYVAERVDIT